MFESASAVLIARSLNLIEQLRKNLLTLSIDKGIENVKQYLHIFFYQYYPLKSYELEDYWFLYL